MRERERISRLKEGITTRQTEKGGKGELNQYDTSYIISTVGRCCASLVK
jgi:hypothetical protein